MFTDRMGRNQHVLANDPATVKGIALWWDRVHGFYGRTGGGVDVEILDGLLLVTDETEAFLYEGAFTPPEIAYEKGTRPELEAVLTEIGAPASSSMETFLRILRRCRDNRDRGLRGGDWNGGSEEELLKRGAIMCNEISRVFVCLCQIAGLRARVVGAPIGGHMMAEVHVEGCWMWADPMQGLYCLCKDGSPASARDMQRDPGLIDRQHPDVMKEIRPAMGVRPVGPKPVWAAADHFRESTQRNMDICIAQIRDCYFHPKEGLSIGNYRVWEKHKYTFPWRNRPADPDALFEAQRVEALFRRNVMQFPEWYFNRMLFEKEC